MDLFFDDERPFRDIITIDLDRGRRNNPLATFGTSIGLSATFYDNTLSIQTYLRISIIRLVIPATWYLLSPHFQERAKMEKNDRQQSEIPPLFTKQYCAL